MLLQFLLKHGVNHRAPFRPGDRRSCHDWIIYAFNEYPEAKTRQANSDALHTLGCRGLVRGDDRRVTRAGRSVFASHLLHAHIVNMEVPFRQRAPEAIGTTVFASEGSAQATSPPGLVAVKAMRFGRPGCRPRGRASASSILPEWPLRDGHP